MIRACVIFLMVLLGITSSARAEVYVKGKTLMRNGAPFIIKGAALLDDSTLWDKSRTSPNQNSIEERDYAFTAIGGELNTIRLALKMDYFIDRSGNIREDGFSFVDRQIQMAQKYNLLLLLDMHVPPGGAIQDFAENDENRAFWNNEELQNTFLKGWRSIAARYANNPNILGYELMNESVVSGPRYWNLMEKTVQSIRAVDRNHIIAVQAPANWVVQKLNDDNILYVFHVYEPLYFTHQNVCWTSQYNSESKITYPGPAKNYQGRLIDYDKNKLQETFNVLMKTKNDFNAPVIVGEFGVSTSVDEESANNWITDVIDLIGENNLNGYIYWRQVEGGSSDSRKKGNSTMAIINKGDYFSPAQFFSIRPDFRRTGPDFDAKKFYDNFIR